MATRPTCSTVVVAQPQSFCGKTSFPMLFRHCFTPCTRKSSLQQGKTISLLHVSHVSPEAMQKIGGKKTWISLISNSQPFRWPLGACKILGRHWTEVAMQILLLSITSITRLCAAKTEKGQIFSRSLYWPRHEPSPGSQWKAAGKMMGGEKLSLQMYHAQSHQCLKLLFSLPRYYSGGPCFSPVNSLFPPHIPVQKQNSQIGIKNPFLILISAHLQCLCQMNNCCLLFFSQVGTRNISYSAIYF